MMPRGYFHRVSAETATRFWVNNPSGSEVDRSITAGAINCTTNPAYCSKLLSSDPEYLTSVIDEVIKQTDDDEVAAIRVYRRAASRVMDSFLPLFERSSGRYGYVTIQDDPRWDDNPEAIIRAALRDRMLGKNLMAKIPVTEPGLDALEACVDADIAICATEVFSISQALRTCEMYERAAKQSGHRPVFFITHISGIFDEYLYKTASRERIGISPAVIDQAGCIIARREYHLLKERGYATTLLGGGARGLHHFTEMVGGDAHVTINWSTAEELIKIDGPVVSRIDEEAPQSVVDELRERFPDFRKAYDEDGLSVEEFAGFGPVRLFRNAFLKGCYLLLAEIASRRNALAL